MEKKQIVKHLEYEGVNVLSVNLKKYETTRLIQDRKQRLHPHLHGEQHYRFIDDIVANNVDVTSRQLRSAFILNDSTVLVQLNVRVLV